MPRRTLGVLRLRVWRRARGPRRGRGVRRRRHGGWRRLRRRVRARGRGLLLRRALGVHQPGLRRRCDRPGRGLRGRQPDTGRRLRRPLPRGDPAAGLLARCGGHLHGLRASLRATQLKLHQLQRELVSLARILVHEPATDGRRYRRRRELDRRRVPLRVRRPTRPTCSTDASTGTTTRASRAHLGLTVELASPSWWWVRLSARAASPGPSP